VRETDGSVGTEIEKLRHDLVGRIQKAATSKSTVKVRGQELPGLEISGEHNSVGYFFLATVIQEEGFAISVWMEGEKAQRETVTAYVYGNDRSWN
jgi:hypothetical protein